MLRRLLAPSVDDPSYHQRDVVFSAKHEVPLRRLIEDLIRRQQHEIHARMDHDGPRPGEREPDRNSGGPVLRNRTIDDAIRAELPLELDHAAADVPRAVQALA